MLKYVCKNCGVDRTRPIDSNGGRVTPCPCCQSKRLRVVSVSDLEQAVAGMTNHPCAAADLSELWREVGGEG